MKAQDNTFKEFLNADRQYEIPVFQRAYSWTEDICLKLLIDIWKYPTSD